MRQMRKAKNEGIRQSFSKFMNSDSHLQGDSGEQSSIGLECTILRFLCVRNSLECHSNSPSENYFKCLTISLIVFVLRHPVTRLTDLSVHLYILYVRFHAFFFFAQYFWRCHVLRIRNDIAIKERVLIFNQL